MNPRVIRDAIFSDDLRSDLITPINFHDCMVMSQHNQKLVIHIIRVDSHFSISRICSVSASNDDCLLTSYIKSYNPTVVVQNIDISQVNLEISYREHILSQESSIHHSDSPRLERIVERHYFNICVVSVDGVDIISKVGSDEIVIAVFSQESNLSVVDFSEGNIHIVFNFADGFVGGDVDIVEVVVHTKSSILGAICNNQILDSEPNCVIATNRSIILDHDLITNIRNEMSCIRTTPTHVSRVFNHIQSHQHLSPSVSHMSQMIVSQTFLRLLQLGLSLDFWTKVDEVWLARDRNVQIVTTEDVIHIENLGLFKRDGPVIKSNSRRVAGRDWYFAGISENSKYGQEKKCH